MIIMVIHILVQNIITVIAIGTTIVVLSIITARIIAGIKIVEQKRTVSVNGKADLISMGKESRIQTVQAVDGRHAHIQKRCIRLLVVWHGQEETMDAVAIMGTKSALIIKI